VAPPLIPDTGGLLRALARTKNSKPSWPEYEETLRTASRVLAIDLVLVEVDYFLREERPAMRQLVAEIFDPETTYEYVSTLPEDIARALTLDAKFEKLELGLVDGVIAAVAERSGVHRVLTTDRRDFGALRVGPRFDRKLTIVP
jgi:predicted nucleic acid-binding protein